MNIALAHDWLFGMRGGEKCLDLACRMFPEAPLLSLLHRPGSTSAAIESRYICTSPLQNLPGVRAYYRYLLPLMPWAVSHLRVPPRTQLLLSFSHSVIKGVPKPRGVVHVCYCFTPMRYAWHRRADYFGHSTARWYRPHAMLRDRLLQGVRQWDRRTADQVDHFVAISRTVARRIEECYGRTSDIVYPPVDTAFFTPATADSRPDHIVAGASRVARPYYLCVSALVPYKRVDMAVEACNRLGRRLLVIGSGPQRAELARRAGPTVTLAGWCTDEEIREAMRHCEALLFPGVEDFGITPVEVQACARPVIALAEGGAAETLAPAMASKPGGAFFYESATVDALTEAMLRFESGQHKWFDAKSARRRAENFSSDRFCRSLAGVLRETARTHGLAWDLPEDLPAG